MKPVALSRALFLAALPCLALPWIVTAPSSDSRDPSPRDRRTHRREELADPAGAYREAGMMAGTAKAEAARRRLAARWIAIDPEAALDFARRLGPDLERESFLRELLHAWGARDAESALAWTDGLSDPLERRRARCSVCLSIASDKPEQALELALHHGARPEDDDGLLENLSSQWAEADLPSAFAWISAQAPGMWRDRLLARALFVAARADGFDAACRVANEMEPGSAQTEVVLSVLHQWVAEDPAAATVWVAGFPDGELRERALAEVAAAEAIRKQSVE